MNLTPQHCRRAANHVGYLPDTCPKADFGPCTAEGPPLRMGLDLLFLSVAGAGFEPATFGL
jgi:hypothetical protein